MEVGADVVQPAAVVHDLGVLVDQELTLKQHVSRLHPAASISSDA